MMPSHILIDQSDWERKEAYEWFSSYQEPYHHVVAEVDVKKGMTAAKAYGYKLFAFYLQRCMKVVNSIENFRYRILPDGQVVLFDQIDLSVTIARPDRSFGFSYFKYNNDLQTFQANYQEEVARVSKSRTLLSPEYEINCVHVSSLPWLRFTSLSHARKYDEKTGIPLITFGKIVEEDGKAMMPVAVHVHHGLVDGYHLGLFFNRFQEALNTPFL